MRKIFAVAVACVCALLGIFTLIDGIEVLKVLGSTAEPQKTMNLIIGIVDIVYFVIAFLALLETFISAFKHKKVGHAATWAVLSLSLFILTLAVSYWATYDYCLKVKADQQTTNLVMACMIISFVSGGCLLLSCLDHMPLRKLFGIVGSVIGIANFGIALAGIKNSSTLVKLVVIVGLVTFVLGFILMLAIPKKDKETK